MPQSQESHGRRRNRRNLDYLDGGGTRFDAYHHDEEHPNPLETASRLRREQEKRDSEFDPFFTVEAVGYVLLLFVIAALMNYHHSVHKKNDCAMTYIYRPMIFNPIDVRGNTVKKYSLLRYHEGYRDETVQDNHIPVLFVPGSSGSGKQVRSIGSTVINMTSLLGDSFSSRFVFYACDFDEEFSFLSGATLVRQREFVVQSIETLLQMYSTKGIKKLILLGHSFGGTILHSLPAHKRVNPQWMDLVITLGAPINGPPFKSDHFMESFYQNTIKAWKEKSAKLEHIGMISFSGGHKDFMVPDHLARSPFLYTDELEVIPGSRDTRVIFRPTWSLRDIGCEVDHNCLAWCNQLVRHISSIIMQYGKEWKHPRNGTMKKTREIVKEFYNKYKGLERKANAKHEKVPLFNNSMYTHGDERTILIARDARYVAIEVDLSQHDLVVYIKAKLGECPNGISGVSPDLTFRSSENFTTFGIKDDEWINLRIMPAFMETSHLKGVLRIGGTPQCTYVVESGMDVLATLYRRVMDSTSLPFVFFFSLFYRALLCLAREHRIPPPFDFIFGDLPEAYYNFVKIVGGVLFSYVMMNSHSFVERNFFTFLIWVLTSRMISFFLTLPLQPVIRTISRLVEVFPYWIRLSFRLTLSTTGLFISAYNINFAYAFVLFLFLFKVGPHSKSGLGLILFSISILMSIGCAGNVNDGPAGIFERSLLEGSPNGFLEGIFIIFYDHPHPLLFSFISLIFCYLVNTSETLESAEENHKEKILGVFYALLACSIIRLSNLESMAISTAYYALIFETFKEYKRLRAADKNIIG